jgi:Mrp family chromosome partitioning ATPase
MTRLDQAFIRVYAGRGEALPAELDSARPESGANLPVDRRPPQARQEEAKDQGSRVRGQGPEAISNQQSAISDQHSLHRLDPGAACESTAGRVGLPVGGPHVRLPRADLPEGAGGTADARAGQVEGAVDESGNQVFLPRLQVDRFTWPHVCCRLAEAAPGELDRLADALVEVTSRGEKVVAIAGCRRGEGATTLLLCAGRRLADRGLNVILADANLADPQVACRLGFLPEAGWEEVLARRLPLEEVVVESVADRLAVLPVRQTPSATGKGAASETRLVESIQTLAAHYDLVLLDPGPLEELSALGASLARGIGGRLDAIALVRHGGVTPPEDLDEVRRWLAETEIVQVGVVENFVRD